MSLRTTKNRPLSRKITTASPVPAPCDGVVSRFYKVLLRHFGPQGWWPTTPRGFTEPRYFPRRSVKGLNEAEMLEICLGALLTQNTSWMNVIKVLKQINQRRLLKVGVLAALPTPKLERLLRSSGYFRQKAARVKVFLKTVLARSQGRFGRFLSGGMFELREKLLSIKGIGPETADSMILYAAGKPIFVVDAYTRRIASRWGVINGEEPYEDIQNLFASALPRSADLYGEYHALLVELGKKYCKKAARCEGCPLQKDCLSGIRGN